VDNAITPARPRKAVRSESAGITFEDIARLALRRASLVSRFRPFNSEEDTMAKKAKKAKKVAKKVKKAAKKKK
jgi:hypothetical protein